MPKCALPDHLKERKHNDWLWPMSLISRGANAKGPRCVEGMDGYLPWPPKLVEGYNIIRWEWSDLKGNHRQIFIPEFKGKKIDGGIYKHKWEYIEPDLGSQYEVDLKAEGWWPSIIQTTAPSGWMKLEPKFYCSWNMKHWYSRYYYRWGWRPDFEMYYNWGPYFGRNFE